MTDLRNCAFDGLKKRSASIAFWLDETAASKARNKMRKRVEIHFRPGNDSATAHSILFHNTNKLHFAKCSKTYY